jgi:hypothetical protein
MTGYKYGPWMYVILIETFSIQTGFTPNSRVLWSCRQVLREGSSIRRPP